MDKVTFHTHLTLFNETIVTFIVIKEASHRE